MAHLIIPVYPPQQPRMPSVLLPHPSANLFHRIIRNPTDPRRPMRERSCAEMLCVVLLNCERLRTHLFEQFGALCKWEAIDYSNLRYDIETEQAVGGKRDDLRVFGYQTDDEAQTPVLLWTIEVKVQAGMHYSTYESYGDAPAAADSDLIQSFSETDGEIVSQLENYDRWLEIQEVASDHKAGIVLSIPSHTQHVRQLVESKNMKPRWHCCRWTDLGNWIEQLLVLDVLPEAEQILARHLLGFVLTHLQDPIEMSERRLEIEDLALIRAFAHAGKACEKRIDLLVEPLVDVFQNSRIPFVPGTIRHQKGLFRPNIRSVVYAYLAPDGNRKPLPELCLWAGIHRDNARVWIGVNPGSSIGGQVRKAISERFATVHTRNSGWRMPNPDESTWRVLEIAKPIAWLLLETDQQAEFESFARKAIEDLKESGIVEAVVSVGQNGS